MDKWPRRRGRFAIRLLGRPCVRILLTALLVLYSPATIPWSGEEIKGVVDALVIGTTGQGVSN